MTNSFLFYSRQLSCESKSGRFQAIVRKIPAGKKIDKDTQHIEVIFKHLQVDIQSSYIIENEYFVLRSGLLVVVRNATHQTEFLTNMAKLILMVKYIIYISLL